MESSIILDYNAHETHHFATIQVSEAPPWDLLIKVSILASRMPYI